MISKRFMFVVALVGLVGFAFAPGAAKAGSVDLSSFGWSATWDSSFDLNLDVTPDLSLGNNVVVLEKHVIFTKEMVNSVTGGIDPVKITFRQISANAKPLIVIADETVVNNTGLAWNGFRFTVQEGSTGTASDSRFDTALSAGFDTTPFTTKTYSHNDQILDVTGGIVADGGLWTPGTGVGKGELVINAIPVLGGASWRTIDFKEQPSIGTAIPLPAAAWTGLSGLIGLGIFGAAKKVRALIA